MFEFKVLCLVLPLICGGCAATAAAPLQFLTLGVTPGVTRILLPFVDDGFSSAINITGGFRFGNTNETAVYVDTNGYFLFRRGTSRYFPQSFPSDQFTYVVAPFWADNDVRDEGQISYEIHTRGSSQLNRVNAFISSIENVSFSATWMIVAEWYQMRPYPHYFGDPNPTNTYQGVLVTNGTTSYAVFIYRCGLMGWSGSASIGYYAVGSFYQNHPLANSATANTIACVNSPTSVWSNVVYQLSFIPPVLQVDITTDPPTPPYPAAIWIRFRCDVLTPFSVSYNWTGYCTSQGSNRVTFRYTNYNVTGVFRLIVKSTHISCSDTVVCSAVDSMGNIGEASRQITNVTGAGLWGTSQPISNNSALIADSAGQIGTIYCHSASKQPHIGRWTSPAGNDITFTSTDAFDVGLHSGSFIYSYTTLTLSNGFSLSSVNQGVYSCQIPDENGIQNILQIGIYPHGYEDNLQISAIRKVLSPSIVINCSTTGLPPTSILWTRGSAQLVNNQVYQISQFPSDRATSTYSNLLTINQTLQELRGIYLCTASSEQTATIQSRSGPNVTTVRHYFGMYILGDSESIRCTIPRATTIEWLHDGAVVESGTGTQLTIRLSINDSIHHNVYACRGYSNFTIVGGFNFTTIVNVPNTTLIITANAVSAPSLGQSLRIRCLVSEAVSGLSTRPVLQWLHNDGSDIVVGNGISLDGPNSQSTLTTLALMFSAFHTSHAGRYICRGSLTSPALSSPLVETADYNVSIQIPTPMVTIHSLSVGTPYAGSRFILRCAIQLNPTVDSPVTVTLFWRRSGILLSNDTRTTVHNVAQNGSHTYLSMLVFSSLSLTQDSGQYTCEASVSASPPSPYITGSLSATSTAYFLTVEHPIIQFQFEQSNYTVSEAVGSLVVCVQLVSGNLSQAINVTIRSQDGTARAPSDYRAVAVVLIFPSGSSSTPTPPQQCTTIVITNDDTPEDQDEYFTLLTSSSDPGVIFMPAGNTTSIVIQDDDTQSLTVTVTSNSTTYHVATSVTLTCRVSLEAVQPVTYHWSSSCSGQCSVARQTDDTVTISLLRSIDSGTYTCTVTDNVGNTGNGSININVTGVALHYYGTTNSRSVANNSIIRSGNVEGFGILLCTSGSRTADVGRWIGPHGQDITHNTTDIFDISVGGQNNPGSINISLEAGQHLGSSYQGVYACIIPDNGDVEHIFYVGIYPTNFSASVSVISLQRAMEYSPNFSLNCTSTGSPATTVTWRRDGMVLSRGGQYEMTQILLNGATATYVNILVVSGTPSSLRGVYSCDIWNGIGTATMNITINGLQVTMPDVLIVGRAARLTCSSDLDVTMAEWLYNGGVVQSSTGPQAQLLFNPVRDIIHNRQYTCRVTSPYGTQQQTVIITAEVVPDDFAVSVSPSNASILAGQMFNLTCTVRTVEGLQNVPTIEWLDETSTRVTTEGDITVGSPMTSGTTTTLALVFSPLRVSHGGEFTCRANLTSPAPPQQLTKAAEWDLIVGRPVIDVTIEPHIITSFVTPPYNTFTLNCTASVHDTLLVPKTFHWRVIFGGQEMNVSSNGDRILITDMNINAPTSSSILRVTENISGTYQYLCTAVLQFPGVEDDIIGISSANVTVKAAQAPAQPINVTIANVSSSFTIIKWTVPLISYTPEQYMIQFGLVLNILNQTSTTVNGNRNLSVVNETHVLVVNGLLPETIYYFRVIARNAFGSRQSDIGTFTTRPKQQASCTKRFQLLLGEVNDCADWRFQNTREKLADITSSIISAINSRCQCSLTVNHISTEHFLCTSDQKVVLYRAELSRNLDCTRVLSHIEQWASGGQASILVQGNSIEVYPNCPVEVDSLLTPADCTRPTTVGTHSTSSVPSGIEGNLGTIAAGGGIGGVVLIAIIILTAVITCMCVRSQKKRQGTANLDATQGTHQNPYYFEAYRTTSSNGPPINPPLPPYSANPSPLHRSDSNASYVKMKAVSVKQEIHDEYYENETKEEALYEKVGPAHWPSEYAEPVKEHTYTNT